MRVKSKFCSENAVGTFSEVILGEVQLPGGHISSIIYIYISDSSSVHRKIEESQTVNSISGKEL